MEKPAGIQGSPEKIVDTSCGCRNRDNVYSVSNSVEGRMDIAFIHPDLGIGDI